MKKKTPCLRQENREEISPFSRTGSVLVVDLEVLSQVLEQSLDCCRILVVLQNDLKRLVQAEQEHAEQVFVTRQAVSRWETGETVPNTETLKLLSRFFDVSINTLLGAPRQLICQCCGMPLEDGNMSREPDGSFNEDYCKWCYTDGAFTYQSMDALIDFCAAHMANDAFPPVQVRAYLQDLLPKLKHWQITENK